MPKLLPYEKKLMAELQKRLPAEAYCYLYYSRSVMWSEAHRALGLRPCIRNELSLQIYLNIGEQKPVFEWRGKKLEAGVKALDSWIAKARKIAAKAEVVRRLKGQLLLPSNVGDDYEQKERISG